MVNYKKRIDSSYLLEYDFFVRVFFIFRFRGVFYYEVLNVFCDLQYFSSMKIIYWEAGFQIEWKLLLKIYTNKYEELWYER